jgi:hypothetical protein
MPAHAASGDSDPQARTGQTPAPTEWQPSLLVVLLVWVVVLAWNGRQKLAVWRSQPETRPCRSIDELEHEVLDGFLATKTAAGAGSNWPTSPPPPTSPRHHERRGLLPPPTPTARTIERGSHPWT